MSKRITKVSPMWASISGLDYGPPIGRWVVRMFVTTADGFLVEVPFNAHEDGTVTLCDRPAGQVWMECESVAPPPRISESSPTASCDVLDALHHLQIEVAELRQKARRGDSGTTKVSNLGTLKYADRLRPDQIEPGVLARQIDFAGYAIYTPPADDRDTETQSLIDEIRALRNEIVALRHQSAASVVTGR